MKICAISDIHGYLPKELPSADVLVIAGDICPDLRPIGRQADWFKYEFVEWVKARLPDYRNVIAVPGNHDFIGAYGESVEDFFHTELNDFTDGPPASFAYFVEHPQVIELGNTIFYVNPYCLTLPGWAYQKSEDLLWDDYRRIPIGTDVIISHGPPLDYCDKLDRIPGYHAGSHSLKKAMRIAQPKAVICGHIHEAYGRKTMQHVGSSEPTVVYNVAQLDTNYRYHNRPVEIEL